MEYRNLGASGCAVSTFALGTMSFGDTTDEAGAFAQLDAFAEAGGTLIDTADVYVAGASETIIGRWLAKRPADITERIVLATKGRFPTSGEPNGAGLSRRHLDRALNASLRRLGVDTVDPYQVHCWDPLTPIEETLSFLSEAIRWGKIRYSGLSNYVGWQIQKTVDTAESRGLTGPVTLQSGYSLLSREIEWEIVPACQSTGLGILTYSPLAAGILTGKYQQTDAAPANTRMSDHPMGTYLRARSQHKRTLAVLDAAATIARDKGTTMAQVALTWLAARPAVSSVILGARTLEQLTANLPTDMTLGAEETALLDQVSQPRIDYPYGGAVTHQMTRRIEGGWPISSPWDPSSQALPAASSMAPSSPSK
jgi:aryl-alcohol dehydrogenase-like predicted oxidoreductase